MQGGAQRAAISLKNTQGTKGSIADGPLRRQEADIAALSDDKKQTIGRRRHLPQTRLVDMVHKTAAARQNDHHNGSIRGRTPRALAAGLARQQLRGNTQPEHSEGRSHNCWGGVPEPVSLAIQQAGDRSSCACRQGDPEGKRYLQDCRLRLPRYVHATSRFMQETVPARQSRRRLQLMAVSKRERSSALSEHSRASIKAVGLNAVARAAQFC